MIFWWCMLFVCAESSHATTQDPPLGLTLVLLGLFVAFCAFCWWAAAYGGKPPRDKS